MTWPFSHKSISEVWHCFSVRRSRVWSAFKFRGRASLQVTHVLTMPSSWNAPRTLLDGLIKPRYTSGNFSRFKTVLYFLCNLNWLLHFNIYPKEVMIIEWLMTRVNMSYEWNKNLYWTSGKNCGSKFLVWKLVKYSVHCKDFVKKKKGTKKGECNAALQLWLVKEPVPFYHKTNEILSVPLSVTQLSTKARSQGMLHSLSFSQHFWTFDHLFTLL